MNVGKSTEKHNWATTSPHIKVKTSLLNVIKHILEFQTFNYFDLGETQICVSCWFPGHWMTQMEHLVAILETHIPPVQLLKVWLIELSWRRTPPGRRPTSSSSWKQHPPAFVESNFFGITIDSERKRFQFSFRFSYFEGFGWFLDAVYLSDGLVSARDQPPTTRRNRAVWAS